MVRLMGAEDAAVCPLPRGQALARARIWHDSPRMEDEGPGFGSMIGLVALVVALVILVFFAIGYGLGRLFL